MKLEGVGLGSFWGFLNVTGRENGVGGETSIKDVHAPGEMVSKKLIPYTTSRASPQVH